MGWVGVGWDGIRPDGGLSGDLLFLLELLALGRHTETGVGWGGPAH